MKNAVEKPASSSSSDIGLALPIAVCLIAAARSGPSLWHAWQVDIYASGAMIAFIIWLASQTYARYICLSRPTGETAWWIAGALVAGCLGALCDIRALNSLSLCLAIVGLLHVGWTSLICVVAGATWMPATGPLIISRFCPGGLQGWERPFAALFFGVVFILLNHRRKPHPPSTPPLPAS